MNDTRGIPIIPGGRAGTREYNLECLARAHRDCEGCLTDAEAIRRPDLPGRPKLCLDCYYSRTVMMLHAAFVRSPLK